MKFTPYYCEKSQIDVILPPEKIAMDSTKQWLIIGYPGVDGIEFRINRNQKDSKIFAFYPIEETYIEVANSDKELIDKWKTGKIIF